MGFINVYDTEEKFRDMLCKEVYREYPNDLKKNETESKVTVTCRCRKCHFKMIFFKNCKGFWSSSRTNQPKHVHNWSNIVPGRESHLQKKQHHQQQQLLQHHQQRQYLHIFDALALNQNQYGANAFEALKNENQELRIQSTMLKHDILKL